MKRLQRFWVPALIYLLGSVLLGPLQFLAQEISFSSDLYPVLRDAGCPSCHSPDGVASGTRLLFPAASASPEDIQKFGTGLSTLVNQQAPEQSLLFLKPTNRTAHTGGERVKPASAEEQLLLTWIKQLTQMKATVSEASAPTRRAPAENPGPVRRLTHSQYNHTMHDLLGDQTEPATHFPQEDYVHGFKNQTEAQSISPLLAEAYSSAAEKLARNAFRGGDPQRLIPCQPKSSRDAVCRDLFIRHFGRKAFRRPLTKPEVVRYGELFSKQAALIGKFALGAQVVIEAMLQSPNFLFLLEPADHPEWAAYFIASRLSYFLWDTMPNEGLFRKAQAGGLHTVEQIRNTAEEMLKDSRAEQSLDEFLFQWLRFDRLKNTVKDRRLFPQFTLGLATAMTEETRRLFLNLVQERKNFMELFTAEYSFVNSDLAGLYGLAPPKEEFTAVPFPSGGERAGILGHASFLTLTSKPEDTSPTERGLFVREHFLCQKVPPPPPGVNSNLPPLTEDKPRTNRQRLQVHLINEGCSSCHRLIDPIGFGFEKFDAVGQRREKQTITFFPTHGERERKESKVELAIDSRAQIQGVPNSEFSSPRELGVVLANNRECQMCVARQLYRYAFGRTESAADEDVLQRAFRVFKDSQFQFQELMIAIATSLAEEAGLTLTGSPPGAAKEVGTKRPAAGKQQKS